MTQVCLYKLRMPFDKCRECLGKDKECSNYLTRVQYKPILIRTERINKILPRNYQEWRRDYE